jgi:hypothetical protein
MSALWILVLLCALGGVWAGARSFRRRRVLARVAGAVCILLGLLGIVAAGYALWFLNRGQPAAAAREEWFAGVSYERIVRSDPRSIVAHVVRIDLDHPGIEIFVTPPDTDGDRPLKARTTTAFAAEHRAQVAINANFYFPFSADNPLSYFPHAGDPVQVAGIGATGGVVYHNDPWRDATFYISRAGRVSFEKPADGIWSAISGSAFLVREGRALANVDPPSTGEPALYARTALGLDATGRQLILVVIEGKQPGRSIGMTLSELAEFMRSSGAHTAINLDGGGSSSLVRQTGPSHWSLVNCTSNFKMPWWERPVANHLGIFARPK